MDELRASARWTPELLLPLLTRQIALYTANESASVPTETARELLRGLVLLLDAESASDPGARTETVLSHGARRMGEEVARTARLWRQITSTLPDAARENRALRDTLRSIGRGFRHYDVRFFPQHFPCSIDYPLARSVSEELEGIYYVSAYLKSLACESALLTCLPQEALRGVWERTCPDWREAVVDLYTPAAANALARTLLGGTELTLTDGELERLRAAWEHRTPSQLESFLLSAAGTLAARYALAPDAADYLCTCARELALRAAMLRDCGGLRGIFV